MGTRLLNKSYDELVGWIQSWYNGMGHRKEQTSENIHMGT